MNQELAYYILDILQTMQDAVRQMQEYYALGKIEEFNSLSMDIWDGLTAVRETALREVQEGSNIRLADACFCAMESIKAIKLLAITKPEKVDWKLEFELTSIIKTMILQFYYWGIVYENPEKSSEFKAYIEKVGLNNSIDEAEQTGQYKYDLTIYVTGYNHLDYTRQCVESILGQLPKHIKYELILFNHGSSDGTKEFFDSIPGAKTMNIAINGAVPGVLMGAIEGKYVIGISNDIILGYNVISNLYRCISEHDDYGWVVPTTPNVSNLQTISIQYSNESEFLNFTKCNNIYSELRHEERVRLCNPVTVYTSSKQMKMNKELYKEIFCCKDIYSFPDDKSTLWMRRNGLKLILAKDAYCHHFGSITLGKSDASDIERAKFYLEGRKSFFQSFGVDPWGTGFCYDMELIGELPYDVTGQVNILGINCGLGSNPLKIREIYKERGKRKEDIYIYNFVQEERYLEDLKAVSDEVYQFDGVEQIIEKNIGKHFNYVVMEDGFVENINFEKVLYELMEGISFDILSYKTKEHVLSLPIKDTLYEAKKTGNWVIMSRIER